MPAIRIEFTTDQQFQEGGWEEARKRTALALHKLADQLAKGEYPGARLYDVRSSDDELHGSYDEL